jgi:hypothetical protein
MSWRRHRSSNRTPLVSSASFGATDPTCYSTVCARAASAAGTESGAVAVGRSSAGSTPRSANTHSTRLRQGIDACTMVGTTSTTPIAAATQPRSSCWSMHSNIATEYCTGPPIHDLTTNTFSFMPFRTMQRRPCRHQRTLSRQRTFLPDVGLPAAHDKPYARLSFRRDGRSQSHRR